MKRLYTLALSLFLLVPLSGSAKEVVKLTRYAGENISGISAAHMFQVELIKSEKTKAVVEIDSQLEQYLRLDLRTGGIVSVDLNIPKSQKRKLENQLKSMTLKLTVYLPDFQQIHLEDMVSLTSNDSFSAQSVKIETEDMAKIKDLKLNADQLKIKAEDMSNVNLSLNSQSIQVQVEDMANVYLNGTAAEINATCSDMAKMNGNSLKTKRASLEASGMSNASIHATEYLYARSSDMASVNYTGDPKEIDLKTPKKTIKNTRTN